MSEVEIVPQIETSAPNCCAGGSQFVLHRKLAPNFRMDGQDATINETMMAASRMKVNAATLRVNQQNRRSGIAECSIRCGGGAIDARWSTCVVPVAEATADVGSDCMG
jgi:hypothetical protein